VSAIAYDIPENMLFIEKLMFENSMKIEHCKLKIGAIIFI